MIGNRPNNSGINPNFFKSDISTLRNWSVEVLFPKETLLNPNFKFLCLSLIISIHLYDLILYLKNFIFK